MNWDAQALEIVDSLLEWGGNAPPPHYSAGDADAEIQNAARSAFTAFEYASRTNAHHPALWRVIQGSPYEVQYRQLFSMRECVAVDLDGTLAKDNGWKGPEHIGEPVKPMLDLVRKLLDDGEDVVIFTARVHDGEKSTKDHIKQWLKDHDLPDLEVTNEKRPDMEKFYDDKAVAVEKNKGVDEALLLESPKMKALEKNEVDLEPDERKKVMKAKAVYPFGKNGADSPAVHKAVIKGKPWYWSSTHRLYHVDKTLAAAIKNFFKIVEPSG
jgi:hypothetical protein